MTEICIRYLIKSFVFNGDMIIYTKLKQTEPTLSQAIKQNGYYNTNS
jgi:hypothetical protein